jgi:hypothetical protein
MVLVFVQLVRRMCGVSVMQLVRRMYGVSVCTAGQENVLS